MRKEEGKAPLVLMEQAIMILVFALAAAICIQAFVKANQMSVLGEQLDTGVSLSETAAELLKSSHGDLSNLAGQLEEKGLKVQQKDTQLTAENSDKLVMTVTLTEATEDVAGAAITIQNPSGQEIYQIEVKWQVTDSE